MSIVVCVYCRDGIVLASDSRLTITNSKSRNNVMYSDNTTKTFLANKIGISFTGESDINGVPISNFIKTFIDENINDETCVSTVPKLLKEYFKALKPDLKTTFFIVGYHKETKEQVLYSVVLKMDLIEPLSTEEPGAAWNGDPDDILTRLLSPVYQQNIDSQRRIHYTRLPDHNIPFAHFNLQESIDFAVHCVTTVEKTMRFQTREQSVCGPVDVLVINPSEAFWVYKKELHIK